MVSDSECNINIPVTDTVREKAERYYCPGAVRAMVRGLCGDLYINTDSDHAEPEFHLVNDDDVVIIFVVTEEYPIVITQCERHWEYENDVQFVYIGG